MEASLPIYFLKRKQVDTVKWDDCVEHSANGLIYAKSWVLDKLAANWDALVAGDYEWVMPLTWKRKYAISYLYQPAFSQQLGVFGKTVPPLSQLSAFLDKAKYHFRFGEIFLNNGNEHSKTKKVTNLVLPLNAPYEKIQGGYKHDLVKNLKHAAHFSLIYSASDDFHEAIFYYRQQYAARMPGIRKKDYENFRDLCQEAMNREQLMVRKIVTSSDELHAIALFLKDRKRIYNLMSTVLPAGRKSEANHTLFDELIREFADTHYTLDFEGSFIPGIASFYHKFAPSEEPYYFYRFNKLPWPVSKLKKK